MGKNQAAIEAGNAAVYLSLNDGLLIAGLYKAGRYITSFLRTTNPVVKLGAVIATGAIATLVAFTKAIRDTTKAGADLFYAGRLGRGKADEYSRIAQAINRSGLFAGDATKALTEFDARLSESTATGQGLTRTFMELGESAIEIYNSAPLERFLRTVDAINRRMNPDDRARDSIAMFGSDITEFTDLGSAKIRQMVKETQPLFSNEQTIRSRAVMQALLAVWEAWRTAIITVGQAFLPSTAGMKSFARFTIIAADNLRNFLQRNREAVNLTLKIAAIAAAFFLVGVAVAAAVSAVTLGVAAIYSVITSASVWIAGFVLYITGVFKGLKKAAATLFDGFADASKAFDLDEPEKAFKIALLSMEKAFAEFVLALMETWSAFNEGFLQSFLRGIVIIRKTLISLRAEIVQIFSTAAKWLSKLALWGAKYSALRLVIDGEDFDAMQKAITEDQDKFSKDSKIAAETKIDDIVQQQKDFERRIGDGVTKITDKYRNVVKRTASELKVVNKEVDTIAKERIFAGSVGGLVGATGEYAGKPRHELSKENSLPPFAIPTAEEIAAAPKPLVLPLQSVVTKAAFDYGQALSPTNNFQQRQTVAVEAALPLLEQINTNTKQGGVYGR